MTATFSKSFITISILFLCLPISAISDEIDARELESNGKIMKLSQVIENVNKTSPGRILDVKLRQNAGKYVYEIELIDDQGVILEHILDAKNGEMIKNQKE